METTIKLELTEEQSNLLENVLRYVLVSSGDFKEYDEDLVELLKLNMGARIDYEVQKIQGAASLV